MLHHAKPQLLEVNMETFAQKEAQWVEFLEKAGSAELDLTNSLDCEPGSFCDRLLQQLPKSSVTLSDFGGEVGQSGAAALAEMARRSQRDIKWLMNGMPTETTMFSCECSPAISGNAGGIAASLPEGVKFLT
ncbi:uncharacterized protein LOC108670735 [Hyalella azteca]|uniref:Uncharacterized protein LOC108670735 n=1 Tax=Hyalella azteca TaxID=294128 RepID=A0A8B7NJ89_HYAAZ|nr:uncharacterized protein LOC108670735 [Hyalella azteca]